MIESISGLGIITVSNDISIMDSFVILSVVLSIMVILNIQLRFLGRVFKFYSIVGNLVSREIKAVLGGVKAIDILVVCIGMSVTIVFNCFRICDFRVCAFDDIFYGKGVGRLIIRSCGYRLSRHTLAITGIAGSIGVAYTGCVGVSGFSGCIAKVVKVDIGIPAITQSVECLIIPIDGFGVIPVSRIFCLEGISVVGKVLVYINPGFRNGKSKSPDDGFVVVLADRRVYAFTLISVFPVAIGLIQILGRTVCLDLTVMEGNLVFHRGIIEC